MVNRQPVSWRYLAITSLLGVLLAGKLTFAQAVGTNRVLFLGPTRPVLIEMEFKTGRFRIEESRSLYASEVFKRLDLDQNNLLNGPEAESIPTAGRLRVGVDRLGAKWTELDRSPQDGAISPVELDHHIQKALGPALSIERAPPKLAATVRLFEDLDLNKDGKITGEEVEQGLQVLRAFDFDDDETLSVAELQPFPLSVIQAQEQMRAQAEATPLFFIRDDAEIQTAIAGLFEHYHSGETVPAALLAGLSEREFSRFDLNSDGAWGADEVELFLKRAPIEFAMKVSLSPPGVQVTQGAFTGQQRPTTLIGGLPVEWVARNNSYQQFDATRLYLVRFIMSDVDKNKYLDAMEFNGLQADVSFEAVDLDENQQVTREEIQFFFAMDGLAAQSRLILSLSNETKTLFEILDTNLDRRLNPREFLSGRVKLLEYDLNHDDALLPDELNSQFRITFTQPQLFETDPARAQNNMMSQRQGIVRLETSGPVWFGRMDDNLDGEVSWREFLGPKARFDELDQNNDNFLDLSEAEAAETLRNSIPPES